MNIRDGTIADVSFVLNHMSDQNRREIADSGMSKQQFAYKLTNYMEKGQTHVAEVDGVPQCFMAIARENGVTATIFIATKQFFERGPMSIRLGRKYLKALRDQYGPLHSLSSLPHPDTKRWFELLGYKAQERPDGNVLFIWE